MLLLATSLATTIGTAVGVEIVAQIAIRLVLGAVGVGACLPFKRRSDGASPRSDA